MRVGKRRWHRPPTVRQTRSIEYIASKRSVVIRPHSVIKRNDDGHPPLCLSDEERRIVRIGQPHGLEPQLTCSADPAVVPDDEFRERPATLRGGRQNGPNRQR